MHNKAFSYYKTILALISGLSERSQKIVKDRYGIETRNAKTLEEIGGNYEITRERVRQIIQEVLKKIRGQKDLPSYIQAQENLSFTIAENNGIMEVNKLIKKIAEDDLNEEAAIRLFLECSGNFIIMEEKNEMKKSCALLNFDFEDWRRIKNICRNILESEKRVLSDDELEMRVSHRLGSKIVNSKLLNYLAISEEIKKNNFGKWGLVEWEEISPKNTREKAYIVLKEKGMPLHFTKIAELIDQYKLNKRKTHFQTVHNELIKDERFVLIGRGVYALSEWGYKKGTVREILEDILAKSARPLSKDEVLDRVLKMRQVKKSTIIINLNNFFSKVGKDAYAAKK